MFRHRRLRVPGAEPAVLSRSLGVRRLLLRQHLGYALRRRVGNRELLLVEWRLNITSFGQDLTGEIYVLSRNAGIYRLTVPE